MGFSSTGSLPLKTDVGRTSISLYANGAAVGATGTEALVTMSISSGTAAVTSGTSYVIPNGKTLRILNINFAQTGSAVATLATTVFNLRMNSAGAITTASVPILLSSTIITPATALSFVQFPIPLSQGLDIVGDGTLAIGFSVNSVFVVNAPTVNINLAAFLFTT